jgi:hypothetical protein
MEAIQLVSIGSGLNVLKPLSALMKKRSEIFHDVQTIPMEKPVVARELHIFLGRLDS